MSTRASIILWSAGSGVLLGLFVDAVAIGLWTLVAAFAPTLAPRNLPRWAMFCAIAVLAAVPLAACVLGYLEGRLKLR